MPRLPIEKHQIAKIHTLAAKLGWDEMMYRHILFSNYKVHTCKELTKGQAAELIDCWAIEAEKQGVWKRRPAAGSKRSPHADRYAAYKKQRAFKATKKQLRMLEGMWGDVSRQEGHQAKQAAFRIFLKNRFNIDRPEWLDQNDVHRVAKALVVMKEAQQREVTHA